MRSFVNLFSRSPFAPLQTHMEKVGACVGKVVDLVHAFLRQDYKEVERLAEEISILEHEADLAKNDIRNHLPRGLFLAVDRGHLLKILSLQDSIADKAEDIGVLMTLHVIKQVDIFADDFLAFLDKNVAAFELVKKIILEMDELLETSFGGVEAERVNRLVEAVAFAEHEADLLQRKLLKRLFNATETLPYPSFFLWQRIFENIGAMSNLSENLANRIRMTLELK